jgi:predicted metal-dependent phosphotriesterase family hydrolase
VGDTGIRAGAVKIATGAHRISEYEAKLVPRRRAARP